MLWKEVADELATWCCTSATLDYKTVESRFEHEGLSFLTISLPRFCKDFERSLDQGKVDSDAFLGFKRKGGLPLFLGGFLCRVFDRGDGRLLDEPCMDSIFSIRQLTRLFQKIEIDCSEERRNLAMREFIQCEQEVRDAEACISEEELLAFSQMSATLFSDVFSYMDTLVSSGELRPRHGPGATADGLLGNEKYDQFEWPTRLERTFPYGEYAIASWRHYYQLDRVNFLEPDAERPVRVISVPKTLETPRIIAIEPTCMQYAQQALLHPLVESLESKIVEGNTRINLAQSFIGFSDQNPNRDLAREGSIYGKLATLDLSAASDRVSNRHVVALLSRWSHFSEIVQDSRSTKADVLVDGEHVIVPLHKFASMGSALCFPMEAMVFLTLIFLGIQDELNRPLSRKDIMSFSGKVRVYGDDIIIPIEYVRSVTNRLESFGYKVNFGKSFWTGKFRESCGGDYYNGLDVTPVKFRRLFPESRTDVSEVISLVEFRNHMYKRGLWKTTRYLDTIIGKFLPRFPVVQDTSPALGRHSFLPYQEERICPQLHRPLVKAYIPVSRPPASMVSGEGALLKCLLKNGDQPFEDVRHLERQGRPLAVDIKLKWMPPY